MKIFFRAAWLVACLAFLCILCIPKNAEARAVAQEAPGIGGNWGLAGRYCIALAGDERFAMDVRSCIKNEPKNNTVQVFHRLENAGNQIFELQGHGDRAYSIALRSAPGKCLADMDGHLSITHQDYVQPAWEVESIGDGIYTFRSMVSGKYIATTGDFTYDGQGIILADEPCGWKLDRAQETAETTIQDTDCYDNFSEYGLFRDAILAIDDGYGGTESLTAADLGRMFQESGGHYMEISEEAVREYVHEYTQRHDTIPETLMLTTSAGYTVEVANNTGRGQIMDSAQLFEDIMGRLERLDFDEPITLAWKDRTESYNDLGDYVEVCLSSQHVYLVKGGELILDCDCVTGTAGTGRETPAGAYTIYGMQSPSVLVGEDYRSDVSYWMPFNGGIGLHDAQWRSSFGGDIYTYDGSHGCVNLPLWAAQEIYQNVYIGYPVICYY